MCVCVWGGGWFHRDGLINYEEGHAMKWLILLFVYSQNIASQLAFYVNLHRAVIGPSATQTGR